MSAETGATAKRSPTNFGPETFAAVIVGVVIQASGVVGVFPRDVGFWAFLGPAIIGLVLAFIAGRPRRIGVGLLISLIAVPYAAILVGIGGFIVSVFHSG